MKESDYHKKWRLKNKEKWQASQRKWRQKNKKRFREYTRRYRAKHNLLDPFRLYKRAIKSKETRERLRHEIFVLLGNKCTSCGFFDRRALQIDHVNGGGNKERKLFRHGYYEKILDAIKEGVNKYQLLCANCNWIKRYEKKEENPIQCRPMGFAEAAVKLA